MLGRSRPVGPRTSTALGECELTVADTVIGDAMHDGAALLLPQRRDDVLNNTMGVVHRGIARTQTRYAGTVLHGGRRSAVADAQAVGDDGRPALIARLTAYRC